MIRKICAAGFHATLALTVLAAMGLLKYRAVAYIDGPPTATTGGFGEDNCGSCHFDYDLNDPAGLLRLEGIPEDYMAGQQYVITIRLAHPRMARGGFEMAVRFAAGDVAGRQAGSLEGMDDRVEIVTGSDGSIEYARQNGKGSIPESRGEITWLVYWRAPVEPLNTVVFHASASAGNHDDSPFGDFPYTHVATSRPARLLPLKQP